jgi:hypothetical protein
MSKTPFRRFGRAWAAGLLVCCLLVLTSATASATGPRHTSAKRARHGATRARHGARRARHHARRCRAKSTRRGAKQSRKSARCPARRSRKAKPTSRPASGAPVSIAASAPALGGGGTASGACTPGDGGPSLWATFGPGSWPTACWRPYADTSPFNQPLPDPSTTPLAPGSANIVHYILSAYGSSGFSDVTVSNNAAEDTASNWDHPVYWAHPGDPAYKVVETEYPGNNNGQTILIPSGARHALGSDGHLAVIQPDGTEEDFWQVQNSNPLSGGGTLVASSGGSTALGASGCCTNSTAANQGLAAGLVRGQELAAGSINHALIVTIRCDNGTHVYPASGNGGACPVTTNAPAEGQRFQLDMSDAQIDALAVPAYRKIILKAMVHYGFYITDTGGSPWDLEFEPGLDYTSFGHPNPLVSYVQDAGLTSSDTYTLTFNQGVDWSKLQVVNGCYTERTC